jgi:hypothetical protein
MRELSEIFIGQIGYRKMAIIIFYAIQVQKLEATTRKNLEVLGYGG